MLFRAGTCPRLALSEPALAQNRYLKSCFSLPKFINIIIFNYINNMSLPASFQAILNKYKNDYIEALTLWRRPLDGPIQSLLNLATRGGIKAKLKEANLEDLYHLGIIIKTKSGLFLLEKNLILKLSKLALMPDGEYENVVLSSVPISLIQAINRTITRMGINRFISYNVRTNNCQDLILNFLDANSFGSSNDRKFVKQNLDELLFSQYPILEKVSQSITEPAGKVSGFLDTISTEFRNISSFAEKKKADSPLGSFAEKISQSVSGFTEKLIPTKRQTSDELDEQPQKELVEIPREDKPMLPGPKIDAVLDSSDIVVNAVG